MTRILFLAVTALALAGPGAALAAGNSRSDNQRNGEIQQGIYDFHRQNAVRQPAFSVPRRGSQTVSSRR
jgi:hypothetical protein